MGQRLSCDTTFLIDAHREAKSNRGGSARDFLERRADCVMCVSAVALGEFAEGFEDPDDPALRRLTAAAQVLDIDPETALVYGANARRLRKRGRLIGANDLWIAATAVRYAIPLVTRNGKHFERIPGLAVIEY